MILTKRKLAVGALTTLACSAVLSIFAPVGISWLGAFCLAQGDVSRAEYFFGEVGVVGEKMPGINLLPRKLPLRECIARYYVALARDYDDRPELNAWSLKKAAEYRKN